MLVPHIVEANGRTVRENNLAVAHAIPLRTLVEVDCDYNDSHGCRMFVVEHQRDCDGSPMYGLSHNPDIIAKMAEYRDMDLGNGQTLHPAFIKGMREAIDGGWGDDSLKVIREA